MMAALSHEFNQPLAAAKTYAESASLPIEQGRVDEAIDNHKRISVLIDRMAAIGKHLRNFARNPNEKLGAVSICAVVSDTLEMVNARLKAADAVLDGRLRLLLHLGEGGTGTAMLLPITFQIEPVSSLIMLAGICYGAQYGGSPTAVFINMSGESSSAVTAIDGCQMARKGKAGAALAITAIGFFFAGTVSTFLVAFFGLIGYALVKLRCKPGPFFSVSCWDPCWKKSCVAP